MIEGKEKKKANSTFEFFFLLSITSDIRQVESCIPHEFGHDAVEIPGSRALLTSIANASNKNNKNRKNDIASHGKTSSTNVPWAIVTSGTAPLVNAWLNVMKIDAHPPHLISAETVAHGKPDPEGYLLALRKLGLHTSSSTSPSSPTSDRAAGAEQSKGQNDTGQERNGRSSKDCKNYDTKDVLVLEDSPAGVRAGKAAGCRVVALLTTHEQCALEEAGADWIVKDMRSVVFKGWKDAAAASSAAAEKDGNVERGVVSIAIINNVRSKRG